LSTLDPTDGRSIRATRQRIARREEILQLAQKVISQRGYQNTSVADVIDAAGISRGTFYLYFEGIDALFIELIDGFIRELRDNIKPVNREDGDPVIQLYSNVLRVTNLLLDNPNLTVILLREAVGISEEVDRKLNTFYAYVQKMVAGALRNGAAWGITRKVNEKVIGMAIIGMIKEILYQHLVVDRESVPNREDLAQEILRFGLQGLQA
jgi:AcrR family transcriptional regulator